MGLELEVEPELLPLPELPVLFFRKVAYGFELSCGEEDIPARKIGETLIINRGIVGLERQHRIVWLEYDTLSIPHSLLLSGSIL